MENKPKDSSRMKLWRIVQQIAVPIAIVGMLGTLITLWIQVRSQQLKAEIQLLSADKLTPFIDVPGLESRFEYQGKPIRDLWKIRVRFINNGDGTIIGQDTRKNIIGEGINLTFPSDISVIALKEEEGKFSFPHGLACFKVGENDNETEKENILELKFEQWREGEMLTYALYISSDSAEKTVPMPTVSERNIIDGELIIKDLSRSELSPPKPLIDRLPKAVSFTGRLLGVVLTVVVIVGCLIFIISSLFEFIRLQLWKSKYFGEYKKYVQTLVLKEYDHRKKTLHEEPSQMWDSEWEGFSGPKCPVDYPNFDTFSKLVIGSVVVILIIMVCLSLIACSIIV